MSLRLSKFLAWVDRAAAKREDFQGIPQFTGVFWSQRQRDSHSLHEVPYRGCFKANLPRLFIEHLTSPGEVVLDPFCGRGTTLVEAGLLGRQPIGNDLNPLGRILTLPRLNTPLLEEVEEWLQAWNQSRNPHKKSRNPHKTHIDERLFVFYHPDTLCELSSLQEYLANDDSGVAQWIRMAATTRLSGHSRGFFSVYTLPPNQAVSLERQRVLNEKRDQEPAYREISERILSKSRRMLRDGGLSCGGDVFCGRADELEEISDDSVSLVVTSPPFLDVIDYAKENWLRGWFNNLDFEMLETKASLEAWLGEMHQVFIEMHRVLKKKGVLVIEVGEVRKGTVKLERKLLDAAEGCGLIAKAILVHDSAFTKTAQCWGINNRQKGTNTHRILVLEKP